MADPTEGTPITVEVTKVCIDAGDPARLARFYAALFGSEVRVSDDGWHFLKPTRPGVVALTIQPVPESKVGKNRVHLDVFVADPEPAIARCEELGATRLWRSERPNDWFQVLADPEGNELCICRPPSFDDRAFDDRD